MSESKERTSATLSHLACNAVLTDKRPLPDHLVNLDGQWAMWRYVCLRGAGFPAYQALTLSAPECAAMADQLIQAEQEAEQAKEIALATLRNAVERADADQQATLRKIIRTISKSQPPQSLAFADSRYEAVEAFRAAILHLERLQATYSEMFRTATLNISQAIHALARTDRFREAVLWQNRQAVHSGIDSLLRYTPEQTSQLSNQRKHEVLVAHYIQRYALKNDSIGFFGPVGCATLVPEGDLISVRPGDNLLATRTVYFEGWCIEALAEVLATDKHLLPWCTPRRMPHVSVEGTNLFLPFASPIKLTRNQAAVLLACDGVRTAREIAHMLIAHLANDMQSEEEVYATLEHLCSTKRIVWTLEIAPEGILPEIALRHQLERIDDESLRANCLASLAKLEQARETVARAAGNFERLDEALAQMDAIFMELTERLPTRSDGKMYAGRTLLYEDCRRDIEVDLGPGFLQAMQKPLSLLLSSTRWFTYVVAELYQQAFLQGYRELAEETSSPTINFTDFWLWMQPLLTTDEERLTDLVTPEFQQRWAEIFAITDEQCSLHHLHYTSDELRPRVLDFFDAPRPGWNAACYHSPDILIQASSPEAIRAGDYQIILGEFHLAMNTLQIIAFLAQHPSPDKLIHAANLDVPAPRVLPILSKDAFPMCRIRPALVTPKDVRLIYTPDVSASPTTPSLTLGSLLVEESNGTLIARTGDGSWCFDMIEVFAEFLSRLIFSSFKLFPPSKHTPRISIDRMIIARESWCFTPAELSFAFEKAAPARFLAARRWADAYDLPRFVFMKVPTEQKPCFIDFDSPICIDILSKMVRQNMQRHPDALSITLTEMLPTPDALWLTDAQGQHYTSELRFVAVDLASHHAL